jgi:hypothetical protein
MYGLVNKAVEGLVVSNFGEETWEQIKERASVDIDMFISNDSYSDSITYDLLVAASEVLDQPASELLRLLGHYWISDVAVQHYGAMMDAGGSTFHDFMKNLPNFHRRVHMIFPNLEPPQFRVINETDNRMELVYESKRQGLEMFVVGLLEGLGKRYDIKLDICKEDYKEDDKEDGYNQKLFVIQWNLM